MVKKKKMKKMKTKDIIVIIISIFLILASIFAVLYASWRIYFKNQSYFEESGTITQDSDLFNTESKNHGKSKTFLFCGLDESEALTDVMMLVSFDLEKKEMHILHIPRDSYVGVTSTGKINSIYNSDYYTDVEPDISNIGKVIKMINKQFKIGIDYYATITLSAFRDVIDSAGGVPIDLKWTIRFNDKITLYPGEQVLNGKQAEAMIRYRKGYSNADIGRMEARSYFLAAAFNKFKDLGLVDTMKVIETIIKDNPGEFTTNMTLGEMKDFLGQASKLTTKTVYVHTVPSQIVGTYDDINPRYGQSILSLWKEETAEILNTYFRPYSNPVPASELEIIEIVHDEGYGYTEDVITFEDVDNGTATKPRED